MAAEIAEKTGVEPILIEGAGGVFDVRVDGTLVFSKKQEQRFPDSSEILGAMRD